MKIYHLIEHAHISLDVVDDALRYQINQAYTPDQWVQAVKYWLRGLQKQHTVSGKIIGQMRDICWDYDRNDSLTATQCLFLSNNLLDHWDQLNYESRSWVTM